MAYFIGDTHPEERYPRWVSPETRRLVELVKWLTAQGYMGRYHPDSWPNRHEPPRRIWKPLDRDESTRLDQP